MKKLLIVGAVLAFAFSATASTISTNVTAGGVHLLSTSGAKSIYQLQVSSTAQGPVIVDFFDANSVAAPLYGTNSTNGAIVTYTTYATNYVTSYVGITGYTNWFTNSGNWTLVATNTGNTNALVPIASVALPASATVLVDLSALVNRGIAMRTTTNASAVVTYNPQ